jgi:hypothetical protein
MTGQLIKFPKKRRRTEPLSEAACKRIRTIAKVLDNIPESEIAAACADLRNLVLFAEKYGQSLDWIVLGRTNSFIVAGYNTCSA